MNHEGGAPCWWTNGLSLHPATGKRQPRLGHPPPWTEAERQRFEPCALLRHRLACAVAMGYFDTGRTFVSDALRHRAIRADRFTSRTHVKLA